MRISNGLPRLALTHSAHHGGSKLVLRRVSSPTLLEMLVPNNTTNVVSVSAASVVTCGEALQLIAFH